LLTVLARARWQDARNLQNHRITDGRASENCEGLAEILRVPLGIGIVGYNALWYIHRAKKHSFVFSRERKSQPSDIMRSDVLCTPYGSSIDRTSASVLKYRRAKLGEGRA